MSPSFVRPPSPRLGRLRVVPRLGGPSHGWLIAGTLALPCVLGPAGLTQRKREGDGATPVGTYRLTAGFFRADRGARPTLALPLRATRRDDGWCDDPCAACYNAPIRLPAREGHERMWRDDRLYDLGLVVDYNMSHPRKGLGSAIFVHVMHPEGRPTAGCIALRPADLRRLLPRLARRCAVQIG